MRFAVIAAALIGAVAASKNGTEVYVTDVVTAYTTYCPEATQITHGSHTYTVTSATTLTISDCPCTITRPASTPSGKPYPSSGLPPKGNGTSPVVPSGSAPVGSTGPSKPTGTLAPYKGAADKVTIGGAAVLAIAGLVAAL